MSAPILTVIEKVIFLQNVDVFADVPSEHLAYLASIATVEEYEAGEEVFREGDAADAMYLVLSGEVRMHRGDREITTVTSKEAFSTWVLLEQAPQVVTATVKEDAVLLRIDRDDFIDLLSDHVQITEAVLKNAAGRLRQLLGRVNIQPSESTPERDR